MSSSPDIATLARTIAGECEKNTRWTDGMLRLCGSSTYDLARECLVTVTCPSCLRTAAGVTALTEALAAREGELEAMTTDRNGWGDHAQMLQTEWERAIIDLQEARALAWETAALLAIARDARESALIGMNKIAIDLTQRTAERDELAHQLILHAGAEAALECDGAKIVGDMLRTAEADRDRLAARVEAAEAACLVKDEALRRAAGALNQPQRRWGSDDVDFAASAHEAINAALRDNPGRALREEVEVLRELVEVAREVASWQRASSPILGYLNTALAKLDALRSTGTAAGEG